MKQYFLKRLLFIPLTLFGILLTNFIFIQMAPGGPVEQVLQNIEKTNQTEASISKDSFYKGADGIESSLRQELIVQFGFNESAPKRFLKMVKDYLRFDFGKSFYQDKTVIQLILEKMPVSISLGLWSTFLIYLISIPLGIKKALYHTSSFDKITNGVLILGYAIPSFLLAVFLIILFCGGSYWNIFPLKGLISDNFETLSFIGKTRDYFWHLILPVGTMTLGGLAGLTFLTKNSFLEELHKNYVLTARAKGLQKKQVLYRHVFRNAMLIVIAGFPSTLISLLFTGSVLTEVIFSLDGLGLLGFESVLNRDYPVIFGSLYIFGLLGLLLNLISDLTYHFVDPRITFKENLS
ncbi:MAG: ABC transporter permease subunit [Alphaproteobacteria bacterium]|nr:ABC transporter permease subunit [Alphaproteobacteria bacterium]